MKASNDPNAVFEYYKSTLDSLKNKYPNIKFVHLTIPLTTCHKGWKALVKKMLGKEVAGYRENINRSKYNNLLKDFYKDEPVFDLSLIESTYPNGTRESFEIDSNVYYALVPEYTNDGGHLNEFGCKIVAKKLIIFLADLVKN